MGHAYAGAVIAMVNDERTKALVYIAALAPGEGETVAQVFYRDEKHPHSPQLRPDAEGFIWIPRKKASAMRSHTIRRQNKSRYRQLCKGPSQ